MFWRAWPLLRVLGFIAVLMGVSALPALAQVEFSVEVEKSDETAALEPLIKANVLAAAREWAGHVEAKPCEIRIVLRLDPAANAGRGSGRSLRTARLGDE